MVFMFVTKVVVIVFILGMRMFRWLLMGVTVGVF